MTTQEEKDNLINKCKDVLIELYNTLVDKGVEIPKEMEDEVLKFNLNNPLIPSKDKS
jgi:hypothetical protein